jgi:endonuclease-3
MPKKSSRTAQKSRGKGETRPPIRKYAAARAKKAASGKAKAPPGRGATSRPSKRVIKKLAKPARPTIKKPPRAQDAADALAAFGQVKEWSSREAAEAFRRFRAASPAPQGELAYTNPFTLLVAVVLSAQATDAGVNKATPALFALADSPEKMVALGEERVRDLVKTIGLFRTKAKNVIGLSQKLIAQHGGRVPREREALQKLAGVGRKTANVVLNIAFGQPTIAVDTHVFRVSNRTGLAVGRDPETVEERLEEMVPAEFKSHAHHWLILHGRYVCKASRPECEHCLINDLCNWPGKVTFLGIQTARQ